MIAASAVYSAEDAQVSAEAALLHNGDSVADVFCRLLSDDGRFRAQHGFKRVTDAIVSACLLVLLSPLLLFAAAAVALTSPGPVLFSGRRVGHRGRPFLCLKFRTMVIDQHTALARHGLAEKGSEGRLLLHDSDPRLTGIGPFLRRFSIDELPQLLNVLRGEMSLVGPRPLIPYMLEEFSGLGSARSVVRPGITGLWQIRNRMKNASVLDMIADDMEYVRRYGVFMDIKILAATIPRILQPTHL